MRSCCTKKIAYSSNVATPLVQVLYESIKKVVGAMFVLFMNLELYSLTRREWNLKNVEGRRYVLVSKAGSNEIVSQLFFMKLYSYTIDNFHVFNMVSNAIRNFTFECSAMAFDDIFNRIWLLLSVHFAAEIEVFVVVHAIGIEHTIRELLYEHLISQSSERKEVRFFAPYFLLFLLAIFGSKFWIIILCL